MNPVLVEVVKSTRNAVAEMPNQDIHWEEERSILWKIYICIGRRLRK